MTAPIRMALLLTIAVAVSAAMSGCGSFTTASDRAVIHAHALNGEAFYAKVATDPNLPDYARRWIGAQVEFLYYLDHWASGRASTGIAGQPLAGAPRYPTKGGETE